MKKLSLLTILFLLTLFTKAQNCIYNYTPAGALNVFSFTPNSSFSPNMYSFVWDFGDGTTSTQYSPTHAFNSVGPFVVCCQILDSANHPVCNSCDTVSTHNPSSCTFNSISTQGLSITIAVNASSNVLVTWDFGDGGTPVSGNPITYVYNQPGTYNVCVTQTDLQTGNMLCTGCHAVTVTSAAQCSFTASVDPNDVMAYDFAAVAAAGSSVTWDFGDGSVGTGTQISHTYAQVGVFTVCIAVTDPNGATCNYCDVVTTGNSHGNCYFSFAPDTGNALSYLFSGLPAYPSSNISWDFGDGTTGTGIIQGHTYSAAGTYTVCMSETDSVGGPLCQICQTVVVGQTTTCTFTSSVNPNHNLTIDFTATAAPNSLITWDFGDNTTGTGYNASHTYAAPGVYNVCISVGAFGAITCTYCHPITVGNSAGNCSVTFTHDPFITGGINFVFTPSSATSDVTWDFGDGATGTGALISHTYAASGTYTVCAYETDPQTGNPVCHSCIVLQIGGVNPNCQASFISSSVALTAYFIDLSIANSNTTSYSWDFGDGGTSSQRFAQHIYSAPGTYNACLTIVDGNCTDTYCSPVVVDTSFGPVLGNCRALFAIVQLAPYQVTVVNLASGLNLNFNWSFGDGTSSNQPFPSHVYTTTGSYVLCLTVSDANGCSDTYCDTVSVDSLGNVFRLASQGFTINVVSPSQLTGVNEIDHQSSFSVYPNPVTSDVVIKLSSKVSASTYRVLSIEGAEVLTGNLSGYEGRVDLSSISNGAYLFEIILSDGSRSYQNIIKN